MNEAFECIRVHLKRIVATFGELVGTTETDEVHGNDAMITRQYGDHFAIEKRPGGFSMQAEDDFSLPLVYIVDACSVYLNIMGLVWEVRQVLKTFFGGTNNRHGQLSFHLNGYRGG